MPFFNKSQERISAITSDQLRAALDDPRLPESFVIWPAHEYPALEIRTDVADGAWYIGYIDLFDGTYHQKPKGHRDSVNSVCFTPGRLVGNIAYVDDPHDLPEVE